MNKYVYEGPVLAFDKCIAFHWKGTTCAVSEAKARCNLAHQFKVENNKVPRTRITLPGKILKVG